MKLKAYGWDDEDYDESHVVWAATPGKAKALLASEHDREFTEMRVYRVPWADKYGASKIIPAIDRIHQQILYAPRLANHQHSKR